jgi:AbrB family looped-hinge helix DNA binding protein
VGDPSDRQLTHCIKVSKINKSKAIGENIMVLATITSKGQITIPKGIRKSLHLKSGDKINFIVDGNEVKFLPVTRDISTLKGLIKSPANPVSLEEMNKTIKARAGKT